MKLTRRIAVGALLLAGLSFMCQAAATFAQPKKDEG
jgi:hypothetical protein